MHSCLSWRWLWTTSPGLFYGQQWKQDEISWNLSKCSVGFFFFLLQNIHLACFGTLPFVRSVPIEAGLELPFNTLCSEWSVFKAPPWHLLSSWFPLDLSCHRSKVPESDHRWLPWDSVQLPGSDLLLPASVYVSWNCIVVCASLWAAMNWAGWVASELWGPLFQVTAESPWWWDGALSCTPARGGRLEEEGGRAAGAPFHKGPGAGKVDGARDGEASMCRMFYILLFVRNGLALYAAQIGLKVGVLLP